MKTKKPTHGNTGKKYTTSFRLKKITSLGELRQLASTDILYERLAFVSAENLGWDGHKSASHARAVESAIAWLLLNAQETTEEGVVAEVNACRDLI